MPLHVTDAPHRLDLGLAGAKLVEVPELALLQQVLAAAVAGELVAHEAGGREGGTERVVSMTGKYITRYVGNLQLCPRLTFRS